MLKKPWEINIDDLVQDKQAYWDFVYTPPEKAVEDLKMRWSDFSINLPIDIPEKVKDGFKSILYVSVITPNQQIRKYVEMSKNLGLDVLIFEQKKDKFTSNNEWKHSLGKLRFFVCKNKNNQTIIETLNIIDFNKWNGGEIQTIKTFSEKSLVDFHHNFFLKTFPHLDLNKNIFEASDWLIKQNRKPEEYYKDFMCLLIKHGIQFENFMLNEKEISFTKEIFLPAFLEAYKMTGLKPLIVALEPIETEDDPFWISYPYEEKKYIESEINHNK